jgi:MFS family permease
VKAGFGELLRRNAPFRSLWTARLLSFFGDSLGLIALTLYVYLHVRSGIAVALLLLVGDFLPGLISPLAGTAADRWDPKLVMVGCEIVQGALIAVIAAVLPPLPVLLALVAVQSCVAAVFQPASRSCVPGLVADADLERANAALGFGTNGMDGFTALAGAALLTAIGVRWLLAADAATFAISASLLLALPALSPAAQAGRTGRRSGPFPAKSVTESRRALARNARGMLREARAGLGYIARDKVIRVVTIAFCTVVMFNAVDDVALVFLARHTLHGSNAAASLVYAGSGLGLLAGFLLLARTGRWLALPVLIVAGYAVSSLGNLLTGLSFAIVAALGFQVIRGLGLAAMDTGHNTLIQRNVPPAMLGRVFSNVYGAVGAAAGLSYLLGGLLLDATNARVTLVVAGTGGLLAAAVAAVLIPRALRVAGREPTSPEDDGVPGDATQRG